MPVIETRVDMHMLIAGKSFLNCLHTNEIVPYLLFQEVSVGVI